jgi:pSer/pThr/pTyr-binding forkhead associated (FHA) protein
MTKPLENTPDVRPVYLIFEFERRAYPIGSEPFTIGRAVSCDLVIREPAVSRIHAELSRTPDGVVVKPFGATPTIVNGLPAPGETLLHHGDEIDVGSAKLTFNEISLPLGVSIVDKSRRKLNPEDVDARRPTITNPILAGRANPNQGPAKKLFKPAIIIGIVLVIAAYYFGVMLR